MEAFPCNESYMISSWRLEWCNNHVGTISLPCMGHWKAAWQIGSWTIGTILATAGKWSGYSKWPKGFEKSHYAVIVSSYSHRNTSFIFLLFCCLLTWPFLLIQQPFLYLYFPSILRPDDPLRQIVYFKLHLLNTGTWTACLRTTSIHFCWRWAGFSFWKQMGMLILCVIQVAIPSY